MLGRVADGKRRPIRVVERIPNDVKPIRVTQLNCLVPLVSRQTDVFTFAPAFDFDSTHPFHWIAESCFGMNWSETANVKADFEVPDALRLPTANFFERNNDFFSSQFAAPINLWIEFFKQLGKRFSCRFGRRNNGGAGDVSHRSMASNSKFVR